MEFKDYFFLSVFSPAFLEILINHCSLAKLTALYKRPTTKTTLTYISNKQTLNIVVYHNRPSNNNHVTHTRTHTEGLDCQVRTFMFSCSNVVPSRLSSLHSFQDSDSFSAVRVPYRAANTPAVGRCRLCFGVPSLSL